MPDITPLKNNDAVIVSEIPIQLPVPHVHGINPSSPVLQETIRKPAGRSPDVQDDQVRNADGKGVQRGLKFFATPAHKRARGALHGNGRLPRHECRPLFHTGPIDGHQARQDHSLRLLPASGQLTLDQYVVKSLFGNFGEHQSGL